MQTKKQNFNTGQSSETKTQTVNWLYSNDWKYFITLTFDKDISENMALKQLRLFWIRLNRKIFGKRSKREIPNISVVEMTKNGRPHFHVVLKNVDGLSTEEVKKLFAETWKKSIYTSNFYHNRNDEWFKKIKAGSQKNVIEYILKTSFDSNDCLLLEHLKLA